MGLVQTKICSKCGRELPLTEVYFYKRKDNKNGFRTDCIECRGHDFRIPSNDPPIPNGYKKCHLCERVLPFALFNKCKSNNDGLQRKCNDCRRQHREENKEHIKDHHKQWRTQNPEKIKEYKQQNSENIKANKKQYRLEHKQEIADYNKKYRQEHKEYFRQKKKEHAPKFWQKNKERLRPYRVEWWKNHKELNCFYSQKRRSRAKEVETTLTLDQWEKIKSYFGNHCAYCGKGEGETLAKEHFIPLSKGGEFTHNNIVPACQTCNSSKRDKDFFEWYLKYRHYSKKREKAILKFLGYNEQGTQQPALMI